MKNRLIHGTTAFSIVMAIAVSLLGVGSANAQSSPPEESFGRHVANCARNVGLDGSHNPGEHLGAANWDGHSCGS